MPRPPGNASDASDTQQANAPQSGSAPPKVALERPHGVRSCKTGGQWEACHVSPTWHQELAAVQALSRHPDDFRLLRKEIGRFMAAAEDGRLVYGKDDDVYKMGSAELVLELRFRQRVEFPNEKRAVRLYFSEPDCEPGLLLAVKLAAKPASKAGLDLQDEHIAEAQKSVEAHYPRETA